MNLRTIDTANVTNITFFPKAYDFKEVKLNKQESAWQLSFDDKNVKASEQGVKNMLTQINLLRSKKKVSNTKADWTKFEVSDSLGTRVQIKEGDELVADMVLGKFTYDQQTSRGFTYARRFEEEAVYVIEGYLSMAFNREPNSYRDNQLIYGNPENWRMITFDYRSDTSFVLTRQDGMWLANGMAVDSLSVSSYVSSMSRLGSTAYVDDVDLTNVPHSYTITIEGDAMTPIEVRAHFAEEKVLMTSSENSEGIFDGEPSDLYTRTFVGLSKFLPKL